MIPSVSALNTTIPVITQPSKQYAMQIDGDRITGFVDGVDAVRQAVYKILNTERFDWIIYSWDYGIELNDLYGLPVITVCAELEQRITDALTQDDRIIGVDSFAFDTSTRGSVVATFVVHTIFEDFTEQLVVNI